MIRASHDVDDEYFSVDPANALTTPPSGCIEFNLFVPCRKLYLLSSAPSVFLTLFVRFLEVLVVASSKVIFLSLLLRNVLITASLFFQLPSSVDEGLEVGNLDQVAFGNMEHELVDTSLHFSINLDHKAQIIRVSLMPT